MQNNPVVDYYHSAESKIGYRMLKGVKHFGYYPDGQENLPMYEAQMLMNEQLAKRLNLKAGCKVLDAGSGEGNVALYLAKNYDLNVSGIDLLDFNVANAKNAATEQSLNEKVSFQIGSYMQLPFKDNSFDGVYTMETLVHAPDYKKVLAEFYRVLKPGGKLVLFEYSIKPDKDVLPEERQGMARIKQINKVAAMPAFNEFTFGSMTTKLANVGFKQISSTNITKHMLPMLKQFKHKANL